MNAPDKRAIIVHGWGGHPQEGWFPWLAQELKKKGFEVSVTTMPETAHPRIDAWIEHLRELVPYPDTQTYFIGHSIGCQAILRYLEHLPERVKIGGAVFAAGWTTLTNLEPEEVPVAEPWLRTPIDFEKIKKHGQRFLALFSDNDEFVPRENEQVFKKKLGAAIIREKKKGHFSGSDGITMLPAVLDTLLLWSRLPHGA